MKRNDAVKEIRRFNRTYLPYITLVGTNYLETGYSLAEARVLFEVLEKPGCDAAAIAHSLRVNKGYLSRMIRKLEQDGLVERSVSEHDNRIRPLTLTTAGKRFVDTLVKGGEELVSQTFAAASDAQIADIASHMRAITVLLAEITNEEG